MSTGNQPSDKRVYTAYCSVRQRSVFSSELQQSILPIAMHIDELLVSEFGPASQNAWLLLIGLASPYSETTELAQQLNKSQLSTSRFKQQSENSAGGPSYRP